MIKKEDVLAKQFNVVKKGYDVHEVDAFLDEIAEKSAVTAEALAELDKFRSIEKQLSSALIMAQSTAASIREKAETECVEKLASAEEQSQRILEEARKQADIRLSELESEKENLVNEIKALKEFIDTYKECILKDMENHREAFNQAFLSDATYAQIEDQFPVEEVEEEEAEEATEEIPEEEKPELDTGDMESIDLSEIVNNLPNADDELKALIDDIV